MKKIAFAFDEDIVADKQLLGNKGAGLFRMVKNGYRVPQGFTVTTAVARAYSQEGVVPQRLAFHVSQQLRRLEKASGRRFGDLANPLLVSVRSGAEVSMPGMMVTVLNLGINDSIAAALAERTSERYAYDCYQRFLSMFGESVLGVDKKHFARLQETTMKARGVEVLEHLDGPSMKKLAQHTARLVRRHSGQDVPQDVRVQLDMAVEAVLKSWNSETAKTYRAHNNISGDLGTAVTVQRMVMGNRDERSCSGVAFSRNVVGGGNEIWGDFLVGGQGEDVVNGSRKVPDMRALKLWNGEVYNELEGLLKRLEREENWPVEVEFTVESGVLYILQVRRALFTPVAAAICAVNFHFEGFWSKTEAVAFVHEKDRYQLSVGGLEEASVPAERKVGKGKPASSGIASGTVVFSSKEAVEAAARGEKVVLVRDETSPGDIQGMIAAVAVVTIKGGPSSHAAIVARSLGKPCVVSLVNEPGVMPKAGDMLTVDGSTGLVVFGTLSGDDAGSGLRTTGGANKEVQLYLKWANEEDLKTWEGPAISGVYLAERVPVAQLAAQFYLSEAMAWQAQGTPLEAEYKQMRRETHTRAAHRIATYFALAIGGELTHARSKVHYSIATGVHQELRERFGIVFDDLSRESVTRTMPLLFKMDLAGLIRFAELAVHMFCKLAWSKYFGGRRWGAIAIALAKYLKGELTASKFCDHAFDLHHNTGSVFGKHVMIGVDSMLHSLLTKKRYAAGLEELAHVFEDHLGPMKEWYGRGVKAGLWKEPCRKKQVVRDLIFDIEKFKGQHSAVDKIGLDAASDLMPEGQELPGLQQIPGVQEAKEELQAVIESLKKPGKYAKALNKAQPKVSPPVLMYGAPGTGKSLMAKALISEIHSAGTQDGEDPGKWNKYLYHVDDGGKSKVAADSADATVKTFQKIVGKQYKPIVFIDEMPDFKPPNETVHNLPPPEFDFKNYFNTPSNLQATLEEVVSHEQGHAVYPGLGLSSIYHELEELHGHSWNGQDLESFGHGKQDGSPLPPGLLHYPLDQSGSMSSLLIEQALNAVAGLESKVEGAVAGAGTAKDAGKSGGDAQATKDGDNYVEVDINEFTDVLFESMGLSNGLGKAESAAVDPNSPVHWNFKSEGVKA